MTALREGQMYLSEWEHFTEVQPSHSRLENCVYIFGVSYLGVVSHMGLLWLRGSSRAFGLVVQSKPAAEAQEVTTSLLTHQNSYQIAQ